MKGRLVGPQPGGATNTLAAPKRGVLLHSALAALIAVLAYSVGHRAGLQDAATLAAAAARPWAAAAAEGDSSAAGAAAQAAAAAPAAAAAGDLAAAAAVMGAAAGGGKGGRKEGGKAAAGTSGQASGCDLPFVDFTFDVAGALFD